MSRPVSQTKTSIFTLVSKDGLDLVLCGLLPTGRPDRLSANWRPCEREVEGSNLGKTRPKKTGISDKDSLGEDVRRCTDPDRLRELRPGRPQLSRGECRYIHSPNVQSGISDKDVYFYMNPLQTSDEATQSQPKPDP